MISPSISKIKERYAICKNCEHFAHSSKLCGVCGCFMPAKVIIPIASCPLKKWGKEEPDVNVKNYNINEQ